ncbi:hypothetical protein MAP00_000800 [Monascus purpureus]|nr:hypothetical protein MAP00_000800 [Monascus purpureus]
MCWRKDVRWDIHSSDDPKRFMSVTSGEYVLAVPDYSHEARYAAESPLDEHGGSLASPSSEAKNAAMFKKVIMKLSGDVEWAAGLVFERNLDGDKRSFSFRPHYDVVLQNPKYVDEAQRQDYDAFRGFRSNHIHLSIAVVAPESRNWSVDSVQPSASYNTVHLSPRFFTHFFKWWSLFSGVMSLPVRQGSLWPGITKTSKKFARHLATVKYKLLFAPLFVAHIYKHKDREEYSEDVVTATGLKVRLDSLKLDVHQRREQIRTLAKGRLRQQKASAMRINQAQLDLLAADFRAVSASIGGTNVDDIETKTDDVISSFQQPVASVDLSRFTIPDHNLDWIDMDDFVELDWILPQESNPRTQILPLAFTPRFTYFRQTDHGEASPDDTGFSKFGDEPTHMCVMSENNDERRVQMELIKERLAVLDAQILNFEQTISEKEREIAKDVDNNDPELRSKYDLCVRQAESLVKRRNFLTSGLHRLERHLARDERGRMSGKLGGNESETSSRIGVDSDSTSDAKGLDGLYASANNESARDFNNRFIIHNIQFKWNNSLRNIVLRYTHQVSQRRGFVYYMSRRAVKFILDIVAEQNKNKRSQFYTDPLRQRSADRCPCPADADTDTISVEDRIEQLLSDANRFVNAEDNEVASKTESNTPSQSGNSSESIAPEFTPQNSYHLRLIAPQIQLQSEKNQKSVLLVAAKGMQLKVVSIMDKERMSDDVCGLVQRRFSLDMDGAQFFVATQKNLAAHLQFYAGNKYGNSPGSAWPPWITLEAMFDFELNPFGFSRIVPKTSASLRYDKYNKLRLKYNEEVAKGNSGQSHTSVEQEPRMDQIKVDFPHFRAICDSTEYYTMYIIVLDLLLFSEPLEKIRNERLEKIMLTSDFSDLRGAPEMVFKLQDRIRRLEEIKEYFQVHAKYLDKSGWEGCLELEKDLTSCEDELFFLMKAITTSQRKLEPLSQTHGVMRWNIYASEVVWHLMKNESERLVEFQLRNAEFERTDNSDGSNLNSVAVERVYGFNLLPDAIYPQIIAPYVDQGRPMDYSDDCMVRVKWYMLEAVAGIPVLDDFEVKLFPLKIQLERELGQKLFEYIFPGVGSNAFESGGFSPMMIKNVKPLGDDDDSDDESDFVSTAHTTPISGRLSPSDDSKSSKGPGSIEQRLRPTFGLSDDKRPHYRLPHLKDLTIIPIRDSSSRWGLSDTSRHISRPGSSGGISSLSKKRSFDSLRMLAKQNLSRPQLIHPATIGSPVGVSEDKNKKWNLPRGVHKQAKNKENRSHLSQMISRASNYMTLAHVRVNDVVLCVSYKGKGGRNLEDIHDFVFRLPVLEYRNKTWSNLDLALRLKKDVTKALISHAPAILGNKFSHHRPSKQQLRHQRELASSSLILRNPENTLPDQSLSLASFDSACEASDSESLMSYKSNASPLSRTNSADSTARSNLEANRQISSSHSLNDADLDSRQEPSRKETSLPVRPTTSGGSMKHFMSETNGDDNSLLSHKSAFRNLGRKLMHPRRGS